MPIAQILEIIMLLCFGVSWPFNAMKSWKARTTKGKSLVFLICILVGYVAGIASKFVNPAFDFTSHWYVLFFYFLNFAIVSVDFAIYFRNLHLDKLAEKESK